MKNKELTVAIVLAAIAAGAGSLNELSAATVGKPRANGDFGKAVKALFPEGKIPFPAKETKVKAVKVKVEASSGETPVEAEVEAKEPEAVVVAPILTIVPPPAPVVVEAAAAPVAAAQPVEATVVHAPAAVASLLPSEPKAVKTAKPVAKSVQKATKTKVAKVAKAPKAVKAAKAAKPPKAPKYVISEKTPYPRLTKKGETGDYQKLYVFCCEHRNMPYLETIKQAAKEIGKARNLVANDLDVIRNPNSFSNRGVTSCAYLMAYRAKKAKAKAEGKKIPGIPRKDQKVSIHFNSKFTPETAVKREKKVKVPVAAAAATSTAAS